ERGGSPRRRHQFALRRNKPGRTGRSIAVRLPAWQIPASSDGWLCGRPIVRQSGRDTLRTVQIFLFPLGGQVPYMRTEKGFLLKKLHNTVPVCRFSTCLAL